MSPDSRHGGVETAHKQVGLSLDEGLASGVECHLQNIRNGWQEKNIILNIQLKLFVWFSYRILFGWGP